MPFIFQFLSLLALLSVERGGRGGFAIELMSTGDEGVQCWAEKAFAGGQGQAISAERAVFAQCPYFITPYVITHIYPVVNNRVINGHVSVYRLHSRPRSSYTPRGQKRKLKTTADYVITYLTLSWFCIRDQTHCKRSKRLVCELWHACFYYDQTADVHL